MSLCFFLISFPLRFNVFFVLLNGWTFFDAVLRTQIDVKLERFSSLTYIFGSIHNLSPLIYFIIKFCFKKKDFLFRIIEYEML